MLYDMIFCMLLLIYDVSISMLFSYDLTNLYDILTCFRILEYDIYILCFICHENRILCLQTFTFRKILQE